MEARFPPADADLSITIRRTRAFKAAPRAAENTPLEVRLRFKGQLLVPTEPGPGLRVDLEVAGHHLAVESESGDLGAWPLEAVRVRRLEGDTFEMTVAGEDLHFIADDTISFAYSGMPVIERFSGPAPSRSRIRNFLGRLGSGSTPSQRAPAEPVPTPEQIQIEVEEPEPVPEFVTESVVGVEEPPVSIEPVVLDDPDGEVIDMDALAIEQADQLAIPGTATAPRPAPTHPTSEEKDDDEPSCPGVTTEGLSCRSPILSSSGYCYAHDPERTVEDGYRKAQEARARLRRKGTARLTKVYARLEKAMRQVESGELDPDVAMAMAQLAQTMCAILDLDEEESDTES